MFLEDVIARCAGGRHHAPRGALRADPRARGRLEEAMVLLKKEETICLELGNKDSLQRSYGNQASILQAWGRLEEAMALLKKQEVLCLELGNRSGLAYCYWYWGLLNPHDTCEELCRDPKHCPSRECERQEESAHNTNISKPLGWRIFASHWVVLLLLATEKGPSPASSQGKR